MCITLVSFVTTLLLNQHVRHVRHVRHVTFKPSCLEMDVILAAGLYST